MTTLRRLVGVPNLGVRVLAGADTLDRAVSWVAVSELADPTPYLEGGELVLTTGVNRALDADEAGPYVARLVAAGAAGLGFGVGVAHDDAPEALVRAAQDAGLPLLEVDRPTPFIAVSKALADLLAAERGERARRELAGLQALAAALGTGGAQAVVDRLVRLVEGWAVVLDARGEVLLGAGPYAAQGDRAAALAELLRGRGRHASAVESGDFGRVTALPVTSGRTSGALVVGTDLATPAPPAGVVAFAASMLGLEPGVAPAARAVGQWARTAVVAVRAGLPVPPVPAAAAAFAPGVRVRAVVLAVSLGEVADRVPLSADPADAAVLPLDVGVLVVAPEPADDVLAALAGLPGGVADPVPVGRLAEAVESASALARRSRGGLVTAAQAARSVQDLLGDRLVGFAESLLAPVRAAPGAQALEETLRVWLSLHGQTVAVADAMGVHRHTVRERLRRAGSLLGRDLDDPQVRAELWLALTA